MNATIQTEFHDTNVTSTQTEHIFTQIVKEQHATIAEANAHTKSVHFHNRVVQTEVVPSNIMTTQIERQMVHNKSTQTISIQSHNKNT